jgi:hypothetical protein
VGFKDKEESLLGICVPMLKKSFDIANMLDNFKQIEIDNKTLKETIEKLEVYLIQIESLEKDVKFAEKVNNNVQVELATNKI